MVKKQNYVSSDSKNKVNPKATKRETGHFPGEGPVSQNTNVCLTLAPMLSVLRIRLGIEWDDIIIPAKS